MQWKNLGEHTVYQNPWLTLNLADVELPDGRHLDHYVIRQRAVALATAVNESNEVLLLWRHRFITDTWGWELAAGVVEDGESIVEAAAREMLESVPDLIARGEVQSANAVAALLLMHHLVVN